VPPSGFFSPFALQKEVRKVPVGGTRINTAAGLDKLESFSAWQREHETNGSESEKQGESESERQRRAGGIPEPSSFNAAPGEKGRVFGGGEAITSDPKKGSGSLKYCIISIF